MLPRLQLPPSAAALAALALAFVLPGLTGHDPWKTHDAISISIVHNMRITGELLVPRVAGAAWLADPPLYHWLAAAFGSVFQLFLEFHAAARLASGALMLAAFYLIYVAARDWAYDQLDRRLNAAAALLLLLGSIGLIVHAHEALPELASLAALCGALAVLPHAQRRPAPGGALFGAALGCALLAASWIAPLGLALAVVIAHLVCREWRNRSGLVFLMMGCLVMALVGASWPTALATRSPQLAAEWWQLASQPRGAATENLRYFITTASWFTWPAWPLALWAVWSLRRRLGEPRLFVPAVACVLILAGIVTWGPAQDVHLIALLAPLALLASEGIVMLRRGAAAALDWFGVVTFAFFATLVWLGYIAMMTGVPPRVANNFAKTAPGYAASFELVPLVLALAFTVGWLYLVFYTSPSALRSAARWAAGIVLLWGTFALLWMPWADYQKSYRSVALQLRSRIPVDAGCMAQRSLGVAQAAALDYHAGIRPRPFDPLRPEACPLLLVQGGPHSEFDGPGPGWVKLADVGRPGDKIERHRLYRLSK
jgi:4-amino-4-deoxy-L-arabinose transferase-like glycosyltransferase